MAKQSSQARARSAAAQPKSCSNRSIGAFLKARRLSEGRSEQEVARYLGFSSARQVRAYESGDEEIPLNQVYALSNCLNIAPEEILELLDELRIR